VEQAMTHEVQAGQFAARNAHTLTESELDTVSGGKTATEDELDQCAGQNGAARAKNVWFYMLGKYGY
jgi:bacteriocin-like protein